MSRSKTRVLVVEDSLTVRQALIDALSGDPKIEVVGEAADGRRGFELCQSLRPDVITMDMMMPVMTGLSATKEIMAVCATPILIVSSSTERGEAFNTYDALAAGAVDVFEKPKGDASDEPWVRNLCERVKLVGKIPVVTRFAGERRAEPPVTVIAPSAGTPSDATQVVAIGASTGGPHAVSTLLKGLPPNFPVPLLVVIHIADSFCSSLAEWLNSLSPLKVSIPRDGDRMPKPGAGQVFLAPSHYHLVVRDGRLWYDGGPERHSCRPSVDVLFESVAAEYGPRAIGCLLTGMGKDGAAGLLAMRNAGAVTFAQDEATSVVYGMPREAALLKAASRVLALSEFAPTLRSFVAGSKVSPAD